MHHDDYNANNTMSSLRARRLTRNDEFIPNMRVKLAELQDKRRVRWHLNLLTGLATALLLGAFLYAGHLAMDDAKQDQSTYCSMVRQHLWPDFRHIYKAECSAHGR